jgi:hypothetical protein
MNAALRIIFSVLQYPARSFIEILCDVARPDTHLGIVSWMVIASPNENSVQATDDCAFCVGLCIVADHNDAVRTTMKIIDCRMKEFRRGLAKQHGLSIRCKFESRDEGAGI